MTKFNSLLAIAVSVASAGAFATEPMSIALTDGIQFTPELSIDERYDDNFREVENGEQSSWIMNIRPTLTLDAFGRKSQYQLSYRGDREIVHSYDDDSNTDHYLNGKAGFQFNSRNKLVFDASYSKVENTTSVDSNTEGDKFNTRRVGSIYTFGADSARTQIDLGANRTWLRYDNSGNLNADKERDATQLHSTLYYRIAPKTRLLGEVRHTEYEYESNTSLDADNLALLAGVTWEATAKTTGSIKVGREKKEFDSSARKDKSSSMWEVGIDWAPRTYSTFDLTAGRYFDEGEDGASAIRHTGYGLGWKHYWLERVYSTAGYDYSKRDYMDSVREDTLDKYTLGVTYEMRRWLDLGLSYSYAENDSNRAGESYERNIYMLTVKASL